MLLPEDDTDATKSGRRVSCTNLRKGDPFLRGPGHQPSLSRLSVGVGHHQRHVADLAAHAGRGACQPEGRHLHAGDGDNRNYNGPGTWEALRHDDVRRAQFLAAHKQRGHRLLPAALVLSRYDEERRSDLRGLWRAEACRALPLAGYGEG